MQSQEKITLRIQNFKSLKDITLEIKPLVLLFGANGSGKTSLLSAIKFLSKNLFSIWDEIEMGGPDSGKYYFKVDELTDLISFRETVSENDLSKEIQFTISLTKPILPNNRIIDAIEFLKSINKQEDEFGILFSEALAEGLIPINEMYFPNVASTKIKDKIKFREKKVSNYEKLDFSVKIKFTHRQEYKRPLITIELIDKIRDINFTFNPNTASDQNFYTYDKTVSSSNHNLEIILTDLLSFERTIPFISANKGNFFEQQSEFQENFTQFYHRVHRFFDKIISSGHKDFQSKLSRKNLIKELFRFYIHFFFLIPLKLKSELSKYAHLPSLREKPKSIYYMREGRFDSEDYYGLLREFDPDDNLMGLPIKLEDFKFDSEYSLKPKDGYLPTHSISEFINYILKYFKLSDGLKLEKDKYSGYLTFKLFNSDSVCNLANASSGFLQLLPIIAISLFDRDIDSGSTFNYRLIEQPELHLHPKLQTLLADFFCLKELKERKFIIETHSEHLIRKIQVLIAKADKSKEHENLRDRLAVYFLSKDDKSGFTSIQEMQIDQNGLMEAKWPNGFFDEKIELTFELLEAIKNRAN